jgi:hypothetical protein
MGRRALELIALFILAPAALAPFTVGHRWMLWPIILAGGVVSFVLLWRDPTFDRSAMLSSAGLRAELPWMLLRMVFVLSALLALLYLFGQPPPFSLPREHPGIWVGVLTVYPLLSVFPQELMYRTLFFHRYAALFSDRRLRLLVNALLFGCAHILVHRPLAVGLTIVAGGLFAVTWQRSRSLLLVALEHSLYGAFIFSAGVGGMFVNGVRLFASLHR